MIKIDPLRLGEREVYKLLIGSVIPRPIAFVTSLSPDKLLNGAPFSYFNIVSSNPAMISLAVQRRKGMRKDTAENISFHREFVIHVVDEENVGLVNETAANLAPDQSEIELAHLTPIQSSLVSVPGILESKVRMECVLEEILELGGNASGPSVDLMIGRVVCFHVDEGIYSDGKIDPRGLAAVSRLAGHDYAKIGHIFTKKRPD